MPGGALSLDGVFAAGHLPSSAAPPLTRSPPLPSPAQAKERGSPPARLPGPRREQRPRPGRGRLPMSELQKASWGWLGEHVHASAPQSPRLQLPRSTTSPSQGVIAAAAAGAAARGCKVPCTLPARSLLPSPGARPRRATLAAAVGGGTALASEWPAGRVAARRGGGLSGCRLGGPGAEAAGAGGAGRGEAVRAPACCPLCTAARRRGDIARSPPAPSRGRPLRPMAELHYLIGPPRGGRGRGAGRRGGAAPGPFRSL